MVKISTNGEMHRPLIYQGYNGILLKTRAVQNTPGENPTLSATLYLIDLIILIVAGGIKSLSPLATFYFQ